MPWSQQPPLEPPATPTPSPLPPPALSSQVDTETLGLELEEKLAVSVLERALSVVPKAQMRFSSRPGFGCTGTPVKIFANHFPVSFSPTGDAYHYDVAFGESGRMFTNDGPPKSLAGKIMGVLLARMKHQFPTVVVVSDDRKNLYTPSRLPFTELAFMGLTLADEDRPKEYSAVVKEADPCAVRMDQLSALFAGCLNYTPYDALQALDIALRHTASSRFVVVGRNLFSPSGKKAIGEGADVWFGYFQSLRATQSKLVLNLDLAATAFVQAMSVEDYVREALQLNALPATFTKPQHAAFNKAISGVKVQITHRPGACRQHRVNKLSRRGADETFFEDDSGQRVSVAQYFASTYGLQLRHPRLPCLHVGALKGQNYLPLEVCTIVAGQKCPRKATDTQVANMIRFTCTPPQDRKRAIEGKFCEAGFESDPMLQAFGLNASPQMAEVQARLLPPPNLAYKNGSIWPDMGSWGMRGKSFFEASKLTSWAVISCCDPRRNPIADMAKFFRAVIAQMTQLGMNPPTDMPPIVVKTRNQSVRSAFDDAVRAATDAFRTTPQVVWMVNPTADARVYGDLKRASDTAVGVVSQCMLAKHIRKCHPQTIANLLMKVNAKLGGKNAVLVKTLPEFGNGTIMLGADVTHPSPFDRTRPSVAAIIEYMKDMTVDLMKRYYRETRTLPERIVVYRDGVSEGQFPTVLNYEVTAIRDACAALQNGYAPPITFIVMQKRHNTRLFPADARGADRSGNVKAGTVVDNVICHPVKNDFYLTSHAGVQGTSRPTHYHVLLDETGYTADEIQVITNKLCYTSVRCTRAVSLVPAAYYAHLLAFRARFFQVDGSETASVSSGASGDTVSADTRMLEIHADLQQVMFYV
ncbi:hypothetical protein PybrP1_004440 [[Pythium] brassicae (nom. inval.)]|nr:hypothetical protein PybrP1_004440 [[Pythium] brassicae (nom. inval.)]